MGKVWVQFFKMRRIAGVRDKNSGSLASKGQGWWVAIDKDATVSIIWGHGNWRIPFTLGNLGKEPPPPRSAARATVLMKHIRFQQELANARGDETGDYGDMNILFAQIRGL